MFPSHVITIHNQVFWLSPNKSIFWEAQKILILSDIHLGKTNHFRKAGIPIPNAIGKNDLHKLTQDIQYYKPTQVIIVGDMFHSIANQEHDAVSKWLANYAHITFTLVQGNHDILAREWYATHHIQMVRGLMLINEFAFVHEPNQASSQALFTFSGHIHPGITIKGKGKQSLRFPCFYIEPTYCILPAYGSFTGLATITPSKAAQVYAIAEHHIVRVV